jgi:ABC-type lipoprotein export system ATPase subunit
MDVESHFDLILDNYKLNYLFRKFIGLSILTTTLKEGFYWSLIYFSEIVKDKPELITKFSVILIGLIGINVPIERYFNYTKAKLMKEIKLANTKYFNDRIIKMSKQELLTFDLVEYFNILDHFNENLEEYIMNIKNKWDIPVRTMTLLIVALNKKFGLLIGLFAIFYAIVKSLSEHKLQKETGLTKKFFHYENIIRNYIINGKNFLINDEFNKEYLSSNFDKFEKVNKQISELNNNLDMNINFVMFGFIIIVIWSRIHELNQYDFFYYFLVIYDVEFISDKVQEYYKSKVSYNKMMERLNYLNSFTPVDSNFPIKTKVNKITIKKISHNKPKLETTEPIIIEPNAHTLITGESGSGKTTLLYILKGILRPKILEIEPNIELINSQTYLTLPNHKSLYSGNLYDIITNYDKKPNIELIDWALQSAKMADKLNKNDFVDIEKLSGGERIRVLIARIIYAVKTRNYNILLFDEIDENLNDQLAQEICMNLRNIFKDKIILYITHNEKVKSLFEQKYLVKKGIITKIE